MLFHRHLKLEPGKLATNPRGIGGFLSHLQKHLVKIAGYRGSQNNIA